MRRNPPIGLILGVPANVNTKYVYGSGVGALNTSVRRYQKKRASFTCCSKEVVPASNSAKNIAYIQNVNFLSDEQISKYMGKIKYLTSEDPLQMYNYIVFCNNFYKITNFCLNIDSGNLLSLSSLIEQNRRLDNCIFVATYSNAGSVRDIAAKNIYFSLSCLSVLLSSFTNIEPNRVMTIVSDDNKNPFYAQLLLEGPKPAYRISDLTVEKMNEFTKNGGGSNLLIGLSNFPVNEYQTLNKILLNPASEYKNFATYLELLNVDIPYVNQLKMKLTKTYNLASNVCITGLTGAYPDINSYTLYENCAIQLVNTYSNWPHYVKSSIVFNRFSIKNIVKERTKEVTQVGFEVLSTIVPTVFPFPRPPRSKPIEEEEITMNMGILATVTPTLMSVM